MTTTITTTISTNATSIAQVFTYGFNIIPYFAFGILILAFGIIYVRTKRLSIALFGTMITSYILFILTALPVSIPALITTMFLFLMIYDIMLKKHK